MIYCFIWTLTLHVLINLNKMWQSSTSYEKKCITSQLNRGANISFTFRCIFYRCHLVLGISFHTIFLQRKKRLPSRMYGHDCPYCYMNMNTEIMLWIMLICKLIDFLLWEWEQSTMFLVSVSRFKMLKRPAGSNLMQG